MKNLLTELENIDVIRKNGHFIYTSGKHGTVYFNKDAIFPHTELTRRLALEMARHFTSSGKKIEAVIGPALGGIILSQWVAQQLSLLQKNDVVALYADKKSNGSGFIIKRGYNKLVQGKRTLVVEDVINTGGSVRQLVDELRACGGKPVAIACLCNRGKQTSGSLGVDELFSLLELDLEVSSAQECKLCQAGVPIDTDLGKGKAVA